MIKMLSEFHIPMPPRCDMKIPLHLIPRQAPIDATTAAPTPRSPTKLPLCAADLAQHMSRMGIPFKLLLLGDGQMVEQMHALGVDPLIPIGGVLAQLVARQDPVAAGVLHVDM